MDLKEFKKLKLSKLEENSSKDEFNDICNVIQIADNTETKDAELGIKEAERAKAEAEVEKVNAEIEKIKAETKTTKVERVCKIGGLVLTGLGTVIGAGALIFVNGMNIEAHRREELKYSQDEERRETSLSGKVLDFFAKRIN